jgi:deoxyribodipyrimidine photolyase-related protein
MTTGIWILGDQLWAQQAALQSCSSPQDAPVLFIESAQHVQQRPYHRQKLVLVWSAMRHFARELQQLGWSVTYEQTSDFVTPLIGWIAAHHITELRVMAPTDRTFATFLGQLELPCHLTLVPNNHFLWRTAEFTQWAAGRKTLLMETFYRAGRKRFQILMEGEHPVGGQWNFDKENRKPPPKALQPPAPLWFEPDEMTQAVIAWVESQGFSDYGAIAPFHWAVTRDQALQVLEHFIEHRLPTFGAYQDAMVTGEETLWHALLSPYLNLGLLQPLEVIQAAEQAHYAQGIALNNVEGFIRQVLGWREYMHGLYHHADHSQSNWFEHHHPLPTFYWTADTEMNCLHQTLSQVQRTGYGHHIQRLMLLSNFALISGLSPQVVESWFHAAFIDAYDWVMQTNVIGMGLFADGGLLASKPYAASANYINRMSDYCQDCHYNPKQRIGETACPFNFFYWDFLDRHRDKLQSQGRMSFILANLDKMPAEELAMIRQQAQDWHQQQAADSDESYA